jgi:3-oxoadipate enol-lactonase
MSTCEVHAEVTGPADGPPVVLGGSLGSDLTMWDPQVPALSDRHRVVRYDHRGHGRSPVPPGPYDIADLGGDVVALLDRLGLARASFVGLSLGGMVGIWLAAHHPERVDRLVLLCTSALPGAPESWTERAALVEAEGTAAVAEAVVGRWFTPELARRDPGLVARMRAMVTATPDAGYAACCRAIAGLDLRAECGRITAPTLVVAGAQDPAMPPSEHGQVIADHVPAAEYVVLSPAAHLANVEQDREVTRLLLDHLAGSALAPPGGDTVTPDHRSAR